MNPPLESPPTTTPSDQAALGRKVLWVVLATAVAAPLVWLAEFLVLCFRPAWTEWHQGGIYAALSASLAWLGLKRGWHSHTKLLRGRSFAAAGLLALATLVAVTIKKDRLSYEVKMIAGSNLRRIAAGTEQFFLEYPHRIFIKYDELVGPLCYIKSLDPILDEDYHFLFPMSRHGLDSLSITLSDGRRIDWNFPPIVFQDGAHTSRLPDGRRIETTYRGGVPDGPFRAYNPDGSPWGEANYVKGRIVGPAWLYTRNGRKIDELTDAEATHNAPAGP